MLGKQVTVTIDRPIGFVNEFGNVYPLNYGYVAGIMSADGEEQDAYVLDSAICAPIREYEGKVIAIIERADDIETKWVVSNESWEEPEIRQQINFMEKYFDSKIVIASEREAIQRL